MQHTMSYSVGGRVFDLPSDQVDGFLKTAKQNGDTPEEAQTYRVIGKDKSPREFTIPQSQFDGFKKTADEQGDTVEPLRTMTMADGTRRSFTMKEMADYLRSDEYRNSQDAKDARAAIEKRLPKPTEIGENRTFGDELNASGGGAIGRMIGSVVSGLFHAGGQLLRNSAVASPLGMPGMNLSGVDSKRALESVKDNAADKAGNWVKEWTDVLFPEVDANGVVQKTTAKTAELGAGLAKFGIMASNPYSLALLIAENAGNSSYETYDTGIKGGLTPEEANGLAMARGFVDGGITAAFAAAPVKRLAGVLGLKTPEIAIPAVNDAIKGGVSSAKNQLSVGIAKAMAVEAAKSAAEMGGLTYAQSFFDNAVMQEAANPDQPIDWEKAAKDAGWDALEQAGMGAALGLLPTPVRIAKARKALNERIADAVRAPNGAETFIGVNPQGAADLAEVYKNNGSVSRKDASRAGLPEMNEADRNDIAKRIYDIKESAKAAEKPTPEELKKPEPVKPVIEAQVEKPVEEGKTGEEVENRATSTEETPKTVVSTEEIGEKPTETTKIVPDVREKMVEKTESRQSDENGPTSVPPEKGTTSRPEDAESGNLQGGASLDVPAVKPDGKGKIVKKPVVVPASERTAATPEEMKPLKDAIADAKKSLADKKGVGVMVPDKKFSVKIGTTEIKFGNTKKGIEAAERMSRKLETVKDWMPKDPSNKTPAAPKPLKVASGKNVGTFDDVAPDFFAGKKDWRSELKAPIVKDGYIYATDGHTLIRMKADVEAKNTDGAPDVKKVFEMAVGSPTEKFKIDASTESIPLEQARAATNKDYNGVEIWRSPEGKIVMRAKTAEDTSESSAAFLNTSSLKDHDFIGKFDPDYIEKAFKTFAKLGVKDVDVEWKDPTKALYLRGGGAEVLVMPMHGGILEADAKVQMLGGRRRMTDAQRAEIVDQQVADAIAKAKEKDPKLTQKRINEIEEQIRDSEKLAQEEIGKHKGNLDPMLSPDKPLGERVVDSAAELDRLIAEEESGKAASDGEGAAGMISRSDSWQDGKGTSGVFNRLVSKNTIIGRAKKLFPEFAFRGENTTKIGKNYSGHWEPWRELIRSKDMSSIDTIPHEVGHGIDSLTRKAGMLVPQDVKRDLVKLGRQLYGNKRPNGGYMGEGFAEYVRGRMTGADNLATECPSLDKWFNTTFAKRFPKYLDRIDTLRDEVLRYRQQTDLQKVAAFMKPSTKKIERTMDAVKSMFTQELWNDEGATLTKGYKKSGLADLHEWRQDFRDLEAAVKAGDTAKAQTLAAQVSEKITTDPRIFASNARGTSKARTMEMFRSGVTDINGVNRIGNVTGFDAAGKPIRDNVTESYRDIFGGWSAKKLADWDSYAAAKVGLENYHKNGLPFGLSLKECENAVKRLETPEFESALSRFTDLTRRALSVGLDVGAITPDQYKAITGSHKYYVRIERRFEENAGGTGGGQANPLHKIKGSSRNIIPPRAATMMQVERQLRYFQTMNVINMMGRDVLAAEKANTLHEKRNSGYTGRTYQIAANVPVKVANAQEAVKFTSEKLKKDFVARKAKAAVANGEDPTIIDAATGKPKVLSDAERLYEDMFGPDGDILTVFREKPSNGKNGLVSTYIDGKLVTFEIPDAAWEKYITGMEKDSGFKNKWAKVAWDTVTAPSKTLRLGATVLNTAFGTANLTRDTFHSAITSEGGQVPVASTALGIYKLLSGKDSAKLFRGMGGESSMFMSSSLEKQYEQMARALAAEGLGQKLNAAMHNPITTALNTIAEIVSVPEMGPRVQEFDLVMRKAREAGLSEEAAAQLALASAKDVSLDFGKSGKVMRRLNQLMPYTNAWYRGLEQVARKMGVLDALPTEFEERKDVRFRRTVGRGLLWITLPAVATALAKMATSDDEERRAIFKKTPREKWDFDDSLGVRLAQPFEFGALFSAIPKAMVYESYGDKGAVKEALWHGIETNLLRYKDAGDFTRGVAAISPFIDIAMNEKWDKAPLVSPHIRDNMPKKDWKDYSTTKVAELVGEKMDWAPAYIDHIANTYTGGMWKRFLSPAADNSVMTMTGLSTFRPRPTSRRDVQEFYEFSENARRNYNGGDIGLDDLGKLKRAEKLKDELSDDFKEARALNAQGLSTDERNRRREAIMDRVFKKIRDWEGGGSNDRSVGIAKAAIALTNSTEIDESTKRKNLAALKDVTFDEVRDAIVAYGHEKVPKLNSRGKKTGAMRYRWDKDTISKRVRAAKRVLDKERSKTTD